MVKNVRVPDENFEDYFEYLTDKIKNIEVEKEIEKEEAITKIDEKYSLRLNKFEMALDGISKFEPKEFPDEEETEEDEYTTEEVGG